MRQQMLILILKGRPYIKGKLKNEHGLKPHQKISRQYVMCREYFHIISNNFRVSDRSILRYVDWSQISMGDVFAYIFLVNNNQEKDIPHNIIKIMEEYMKKGG